MARPDLASLVQALGARDFGAAERLAREACQRLPDDALARRYLAAILLEQGRAGEALAAIETPPAVKNDADLDFLRGHACAALGQSEAAADCFALATAARPGFAQAWAAQGLMRHRAGALAQGQLCYETALRLAPGDSDTLEKLAALRDDRGDPAGAQKLLEAALATQPQAAGLWAALGLSRLRSGGDALAPLAEARRLAPASADHAYNHALALAKAGDAAAAESAYRAALALAPDMAAARLNLGNLLATQKRYAQAAEQLAAADPQMPDVARSLASVHLRAGNPAAAAAAAEAGLQRHPGDPELRLTLAAAFWEIGRLAEAEAIFRRLLEFEAIRPSARQGLSNVFYELARPDEAMAELREALDERPGDANLAQSLAFVAQYSQTADARTRLGAARLAARAIEAGAPAPAEVPARARGNSPWRIGVVSGDLHGHPVGQYLAAVLAGLPKAQAQIFCYANGAKDDATNAAIRAAATRWLRVETLDDRTLAAQIRADGIDVLLDLSGYTPHNRLGVFAARAAPLQGSWLGYPAPTALRQIDFALADRVLTPGPMAADFDEKIVWMEGSCMPYAAPFADLPTPVRPPLAGRAVRFGSYSNAAKLSPGTLAAWGEIMRALPGATLRLCGRQYGLPEVAQVLRARFAAEGVAGERLVLVPAMARRALVESYAEIDIALDTFPWSGGATSFEALWMGAPLVTLAADRPIGRVSASILAAMGHRDLIADSPHEYVETAIGLARDLAHLEALQARMRPALEASACFDMARYAAAFLAAIATAWADKQLPSGA